MDTLFTDVVKIKEYDGTNYKQWAFDMRRKFMGAACWDIVEGKETCPASGDEEEVNDWTERRETVFIAILDTLTDNMQHEYGYGRFNFDPVNLWKQIETDYIAQVKRNSYILRHELSATTLEDCGSVDIYVSKIQSAIKQYNLVNADSQINEDEHRYYLLHGLPQYEYEDWGVTVQLLFDKMAGPEEIVAMLQKREMELRKKKSLKPDQLLYTKGATKANEAASIFTLSTELLLEIIEVQDLWIQDLVSLSFSCKAFHRIIKEQRYLEKWIFRIHGDFSARHVIKRIVEKRIDTAVDDYLLHALRSFATHWHVIKLRGKASASYRQRIYDSTAAAFPGTTPQTKRYWIEALSEACEARYGLPVFPVDPLPTIISDALAAGFTSLFSWDQDKFFEQWLLPHEGFASDMAIERGDHLALRVLLTTGWASTPRCLQQAASKVLVAIDDESVGTSVAMHTVKTIIDAFADQDWTHRHDVFLMCLMPIRVNASDIFLDCSLCPPTSEVAATLLKVLLKPSAACSGLGWHRADLMGHAFITALGKAIEYITIGEGHDATSLRVLQAWLGSPSVTDVLLPPNLGPGRQLLQDALRLGGPQMLRELLCIWIPCSIGETGTLLNGIWKLKTNLHGISTTLQAHPPRSHFYYHE
jgi:hypothetical protein